MFTHLLSTLQDNLWAIVSILITCFLTQEFIIIYSLSSRDPRCPVVNPVPVDPYRGPGVHGDTAHHPQNQTMFYHISLSSRDPRCPVVDPVPMDPDGGPCIHGDTAYHPPELQDQRHYNADYRFLWCRHQCLVSMKHGGAMVVSNCWDQMSLAAMSLLEFSHKNPLGTFSTLLPYVRMWHLIFTKTRSRSSLSASRSLESFFWVPLRNRRDCSWKGCENWSSRGAWSYTLNNRRKCHGMEAWPSSSVDLHIYKHYNGMCRHIYDIIYVDCGVKKPNIIHSLLWKKSPHNSNTQTFLSLGR